jgi:TatD DNase family protein
MADERERTPRFPDPPKTQVVLPEVAEPLCDSHAHLDMLDDPAGALARAAEAGFSLVASVVDLAEDPERTIEGLDPWLATARELGGAPDVVLIAGVHPHNAKHHDAELLARLRTLATGDPRVRGLGELGLDFHYDHSPRDDQRAMFRDQLALAAELDLPVTVHLREAHDEGLAIMAEVGVPAAGCIIHCFTEGAELAERFLALSPAVVVSFAGPVTFNKAVQIREAVAVVPLDRLLVETDCPFLAPAPYRGMPNEPAFAALNAAAVAEVKGVTIDEVAAASTATARRLFRVG